MSIKGMPTCSLALSITALGTVPTGDWAAVFITRIARLNCSSSQNTMPEAASATPRQPKKW